MKEGIEQQPQPIIDLETIANYLTEVVVRYETSAPIVSQWADRLYVTLGEDTGKVTVRELQIAQFLFSDGMWEQPNMATNRVYKLMSETGQDTTGQAGF
jgi:hypothetical protein